MPPGKRDWTSKWVADGEESDEVDAAIALRSEAGPSTLPSVGVDGLSALKAKEPLFQSEEDQDAPPTVGPSDLPPTIGAGPAIIDSYRPPAPVPEPAVVDSYRPSRLGSATPERRLGFGTPGSKKKPLLAAVAVAGSSSPVIQHTKSRALRRPTPSSKAAPSPSPAPEAADGMPPSVAPLDDLPPSVQPFRRARSNTPVTPGSSTRSAWPPPPKPVRQPAAAVTSAAPDLPDHTPLIVAAAADDGPSAVADVPAIAPIDDGPRAVGATAPVVAALDNGPPTVGTTAPIAPPDGLPPSVGAAPVADSVPVVEAIPPDVTPAASAADPAALAAALVASITPAAATPATPPETPADNARVRRRRGGGRTQAPAVSQIADDGDDGDGDSPAPAPKKRGRPKKVAAEADDSADESVDSTSASAKKRKVKTPASRRPKQRSAPRLENPELDGLEPDGMVGEDVDVSELSLSELATISRGRVSARTIKLHQFQRAEAERKAKERVERAEANWKKRQLIRRKAREIKNEKRAERREAAKEAGLDADDAISDDSVDSDEDYTAENQLTPPSSPSYFGKTLRNAPIVFDADQRARMTAQAEEAAAGSSRAARRQNDEEEDIEGLGLYNNIYEDDDDPMAGHEDLGEDFRLEVEEDAPPPEGEFAGLESTQFTGGHFDDDGNWVEGTADGSALLRRNEENRRKILEGDDDRQVEIVDNDTQFINSSTWGKKVVNERWTTEETELFFSVSLLNGSWRTS